VTLLVRGRDHQAVFARVPLQMRHAALHLRWNSGQFRFRFPASSRLWESILQEADIQRITRLKTQESRDEVRGIYSSPPPVAITKGKS
jgi:hypothetical protein